MRTLAAAVIMLIATQLPASPYDPLIDAAARRRGVDPVVLRAIAAQESGKNPWTFNADGESFRFNDKSTTVRTLWSLTKAPWMVKVVPLSGKASRRFFQSQPAAQAYATHLSRTTSLRLRTDDSKAVDRGEIRVRQLRMVNTDLGIAQISYRWHGQGVASVQRWLDPVFNLDYAASHLAALRRKHGSDLAAAGYYHSATDDMRKLYMAGFMPKYNKEKRNAGVSLAAAR